MLPFAASLENALTRVELRAQFARTSGRRKVTAFLNGQLPSDDQDVRREAMASGTYFK